MKIMLLSRYGRLGASSRIRTFQYIPYLNKFDIYVDVFPLFDDKYLIRLYKNNQKPFLVIATRYIKRIINLIKIRQYDLIWIEKEILPMFPSVFEKLIFKFRKKYIVDYDDAIFHNYDLNRNILVRKILGNKIDIVMKNASAVIVGNEYLYKRAYNAGAKKIFILPSVVDLSRYTYSDFFNKDTFVIGWIGSPATSKYIEIIYGALKKFSYNYKNVKVVLVGANRFQIDLPDDNVEFIEWNEEREVEYIRMFDVGIMPLYNAPWERGKCGYKLIQYMACGRPVIASPVGINEKLIIEGENGFKAKTLDDWYRAFEKLYLNISLRREMGYIGRKIVEKEYSLNVTSRKLVNIIKGEVKYEDRKKHWRF